MTIKADYDENDVRDIHRAISLAYPILEALFDAVAYIADDNGIVHSLGEGYVDRKVTIDVGVTGDTQAVITFDKCARAAEACHSLERLRKHISTRTRCETHWTRLQEPGSTCG